MRFFLLPFTLFFWFLISYYSLSITYAGILFICKISWLWIIITFPILIGIVAFFGSSLPSIISFYLKKLYNNRIINILHFLVGIIGCVIFIFYLVSPTNYSLLSDIWSSNKWKVIINAFPFLGLLLSCIMVNVKFLNPIIDEHNVNNYSDINIITTYTESNSDFNDENDYSDVDFDDLLHRIEKIRLLEENKNNINDKL